MLNEVLFDLKWSFITECMNFSSRVKIIVTCKYNNSFMHKFYQKMTEYFWLKGLLIFQHFLPYFLVLSLYQYFGLLENLFGLFPCFLDFFAICRIFCQFWVLKRLSWNFSAFSLISFTFTLLLILPQLASSEPVGQSQIPSSSHQNWVGMPTQKI